MATDARSGDAAVAAGREALARRAWEEARAAFESALATEQTPEALEGLSWAAWWTAEDELLFEARERAYALYRDAGDPIGAARMATWLGTDSVDFRGEFAVASGWLSRARRLLEGTEESAAHGWLWVHEAEQLIYAENTRGARERGVEAAELGRRLESTELEMMGLSVEGLALVTEGEVDRGMRGLDECAAAALGGEFEELVYVSFACCFVIYACERARDYDRAAQWCDRAVEFAERIEMEALNRLCRAHHAGVLIWRGMWADAEAELVAARDGLARTRPALVAEATVRLGELRRRQGRAAEAEELLVEAGEHPLALLSLAELHLDSGDPLLARDLVERLLAELPDSSRTQRAAALELAVRAHAACGERVPVDEALSELRGIGETVTTEPLRGCVSFAAGVAAVARDEHDAARRSFLDATYAYQRSGAPFEASRARIELAKALAALGRAKHSVAEAEEAAKVLSRVGAHREAERAKLLIGEAERTSRLTKREREVLRLVAEGKSDKAIAGELVVSEHTVHRHVANVLAKLDARSRSAAVAEALRSELI